MLIRGLVDIQDLNTQQSGQRRCPLRSHLMTKMINHDYYVSVCNSMYPTCMNYKVTDLDQVHSKFVQEGKISLRFKHPKHLVLVQADDKTMLPLFLRQIQEIISGKKIVIGTRNIPKSKPTKKKVNPFDPASESLTLHSFDNRVLNMKNLNTLVLDHCTLTLLPAQIGDLPISYLSFEGSTLFVSSYGEDTIWNWMSGNRIMNTLTTLKLDSTDLKRIPFEMMFLRNLQTLSVTKNKLKYLPPWLSELRNLKTLFLADNNLMYLPDGFFSRMFKELDISNNNFGQCFMKDDHIYKYIENLDKCDEEKLVKTVKKLGHISIHSLVEYCVRFMRQDIPRTLWPYFDVVSRCVHCTNYVLPDYVTVKHSIARPATRSLIKNHMSSSITWQSVVCRSKCFRFSSY